MKSHVPTHIKPYCSVYEDTNEMQKITTRLGYSLELPKGSFCEVVLFPYADGKQANMKISVKEKYSHRLREYDSERQTAQQLLNMVAAFQNNGQSKKPVEEKSKIERKTVNTTAENTAEEVIDISPAEENKVEKEKCKIKRKIEEDEPAHVVQYDSTDNSYYLDGYYLEDDCVDLYKGIITDEETREIYYKFRGLRALKRTYNAHEDEFLLNVTENKSVYCVITTDSKPDIPAIKQIGRNLREWIEYNYRFSYAIIVYEPCEDGSWHINLVINFFDGVPQNFGEELRKWAAPHNKKPSPHQVTVRILKSKDEIHTLWIYLDPTRAEKAKRAVYYKRGFNCFSVFGRKRINPEPILTTTAAVQEIVKKVEGQEQAPLNKQYIFKDLFEDTDIRTISIIYYTLDLQKLKAIYANSQIPKEKTYKAAEQPEEEPEQNEDEPKQPVQEICEEVIVEQEPEQDCPEQLCLFAPMLSRLSSDEIFCKT